MKSQKKRSDQYKFAASSARKLTASLSLAGLLLSTTIPVYAVDAQESSSLDQVPHGELLSNILGITTQVTQQIGQSRAQTQAIVQSQQMMSQLAPQSIPAKFFPQCQIPVTAPNLPMGYCDNPPSSPFEFEMMNNLREVAVNYERYYKMMLTPAQNSPFPSGLKCLTDAKTAVTTSMVERQNALQVLIDRINKESQLFRDENKRLLQNMQDLSAELYGGGGSGSTENRTLNFENEFSPECVEVIGSQRLAPQAAQSGGLIGLQDSFRKDQDSAVDYQLRQTNIEASYESLIQELSADLSDGGLSELNFSNPIGPGRISFAPLNNEVTTRLQRIETKRKNTENELNQLLGSSVGGQKITIPTNFNSTFVQDFDRFIKRSDEFYRKKYIGECVSGKSSGVALSTDQLINSLRSHAGQENGSNYSRYVQRLEVILKSDSYIEDKMAEISNIDRTFNGEVILKNFKSTSTKKPLTPYQFLQEAIAKCEQVYLSDKTYSTNGPTVAGANSINADVQRAKALMEDFKKDVIETQSQIISDIENRVRNCEGQTLNPRLCADSKVFNPQDANFCLSAASSCSSIVQSCNARMNQLVEEKKVKIKIAAQQFNQAVEALATRQEQILNQVRNQVLADAEYLKNYFPGADYIYPPDLFVKLQPKELLGGELVYGAGEIDFKDLAENVGKLKEQLAQQTNGIQGVIDDYIKAQEKQIADNRKDWANIASTCQTAANNFIASQNKQQQDQIEKQQKDQAELATFCRKYNSLASAENPAAGCSGPFSPEKLFEDSVNIAAYIDNRALASLGSYTALCNQTQNERTKGSEASEENDFNFLTACKSGSEDIKDRLVSDIERNVPMQLEDHKQAILDFLNGTGALPQAVKDDRNYLSFLESIKVTLSSSSQEVESEFKAAVRGLNTDPAKLAEYEKLVKESIGNSNDPFCQRVAFNKAKEAVTRSRDGITEGKFDDFSKNLKTQLESADKDFNKISRGIASTGNSKDLEWKRIGQAVTGNCEAYNNVTREGGLLGEVLGNPTDGLDLRSLGIGR